MKNNLLIILLLLIFIGSCKKSTDTGIEAFYIHINDEKETIYMSELFSSAKYIPLVTDTESIINEIIKIYTDDNHVYIADRLSLYKFSMHGSLISKIQKNGPGPDEYISISDFQIDADSTVWILSRNSKCLYKYSWENELIEKIQLNNWVSNIYLIDSDNMMLYNGNEIESNGSRLEIVNLKEKKIINEYLKTDVNKSTYLHVRSKNHFYSDSHMTYFYELFNDTIYSINKDSVSPLHYVNIDNKNIPSSFFDKSYENIMDFFQNLSKSSYAYGINVFIENKEKYLISYYYNKECYVNVTWKNDFHQYNCKTIFDDIGLHQYPINFSDLSFFSCNNKVIIPLLPSDIIEYACEYLTEKEIQEVKKKINYISDDQNPVVLICEL